MTRPIVLLAGDGSVLAERLAARLAETGRSCVVLDIDAPLNGEPVTVRATCVTWQGLRLDQAAALWLEHPIFPWPQPLLPPCPLPDLANVRRWVVYQREARGLALSALAATAETVPVLNPVASAHTAVAPTVALDLLAARGLPVHSWRVISGIGGASAPAQPGDYPADGTCSVDATGRDRWHRPADLPATAPRLSFGHTAGSVVEILVVGGEVVGSRCWQDARAWAAERSGAEPKLDGPSAGVVSDPAPWTELCLKAAAALGLEIAAFSLATGAQPAGTAAPTILLADAAPDLGIWERLLDGAVSAALAHRLSAVADGSSNRGVRP